ncbi:hypothetical protein [Streptomyces sp. NPDC059916]|uniref:hypothetical protein n=1 Tax=Streptomyces sp. NPDC059916 TaxID=3347001 RepID=UPI0036CC9510
MDEQKFADMAGQFTVFPEERMSATASRWNSSVYRLLRLLLPPTWHCFLWNLMSQFPGVLDQGEVSELGNPKDWGVGKLAMDDSAGSVTR